MNRRLFLPFALLLSLAAGCRSEQETAVAEARDTVPSNLNREVSKTEKVGKTARSHAYIKRFYQEQGDYFVTVDYIQYLTGNAAIATARRRGDAAADVQNGDTVYSVFNDYYIINDDTKQRILQLSPEAAFMLWDKSAALRRYTATPAEVMALDTALLRYAPFIVETKRGIVTNLTEQFIP
ncbi:hypothetical protein [Hymenobacter sp. AT01-02]|uniref:hypothetical protein n=1 Tax=Hymenobacter sp. AT01-02 TaxID=1571877 RepID=UPI0005F2308E|nr:hypothetical protein [Hymenobacter sp. AT01-02]